VLQGGFGTCYEVKEVSTNDVLAIKIAPKKHLDASKSKRRHLQDEIQIHSSLSVRFRDPARWLWRGPN
jgi:serine/threonine protein kinase